MLSLLLVVGIWTTTCIQSQNSQFQGFVTESYAITSSGKFTFTREWFMDPHCSDFLAEESETGHIVVGKKVSSIFVGDNTFEVDFISNQGADRGAIKVEKDHIKVGRGMKNSGLRNTMVGIFEYWLE